MATTKIRPLTHADVRSGSAKTQVRPLEPAYLPAVDELLQAHLADYNGDPGFLATTLLDDPWADSELPSLVAVSRHDEVVGFLGAHVRRMRFGKRRIRAVCCSHLVVAPEHRGIHTATMLLERLMAGPQAITWSDVASDAVVHMSRAFGGQIDHARACDWMIVLRPARWISEIGISRLRRRTLGRDKIPVGGFPFHAMSPRLLRQFSPTEASGVTGDEVDTETLVELIPGVSDEFDVRVDYDVQFLDHLFGQIESVFGTCVRRVVRRHGRPIGWYAYLPDTGKVSRVLHLACSESESGAVVGELMAHARDRRIAVLTGRAGPHLRTALRHRLAILGYARQPVVHAYDPQLRALLSTPSSLLTQLDGEWFVT